MSPSKQKASRVEFASFLARLAFWCAQDYAGVRIRGETPEHVRSEEEKWQQKPSH